MPEAPAKILVVDDIEENRDLLMRRLARKGHEVETAVDGQSALAMVSKQPFDIILLDIMMPGMSGLEALERLRQTWGRSALPVIMVSAKSESQDVVKALELGANDYITKPIDFPVAFARIETQLALKRADEAVRESQERFALAMEGASDGLWDWNLAKREVFFSPRWKAMLGYDDSELPNQISEWFDRVHEKDVERVRADLNKHLEGISLRLDTTYRIRHSNGTFRWAQTFGMAQRDAEGKAIRVAGSQSDVTERIVTDPHTGIPNRMHFLDCVERAIGRRERREGYEFAVIMLELDSFDDLKSGLGHALTDQFQRNFATRLKAYTRPGDTVALIGDSSFAMLTDEIDMVADAVRIARRIRDTLEKPYDVFGQDVSSTVSIGIAASFSDYASSEEILRDATLGLRSAQEQGGDRCQVFDPELHAQAVSRLQLESDLRRAMAAEEFELHYQPIVDLELGRTKGFEALIRWNRAGHGMVSPVEFIPVAERTSLINPIGKWVLQEACRQAMAWKEADPATDALVLSVNVSPKQLRHVDLADQIKEILSQTGFDPRRLKVEITETAVLEDLGTAIDTLQQLNDLGISISIDDFGTGYSSLSTLHRIPIDTIKIDRSFVSGVENDPTASQIVKTIISMASSLGKDVIAEGIETEAQAAIIRAMGCRYGQGYLYSKPMPAEDAFDFVCEEARGSLSVIKAAAS